MMPGESTRVWHVTALQRPAGPFGGNANATADVTVAYAVIAAL